MTYEEALSDTIEVKRQLDEDFQNADFGILANLIDYYIEALEKQIPKKPVERIVDCGFNLPMPIRITVCPVCGVDTPIPRKLKSWELWCPDCGQSLKWSEEE